MTATKELPILPFAAPSLWEEWLAAHHDRHGGVWIQIAKKGSGVASVTYDQALDVALCYGWIDGQRRTHDERFFLQKFTPRRPSGLWSKRNIEKVAALTAARRMQPAGLAEVEAAMQDGRWDAAYDSPKNMVVPDDFLKALGENTAARAFFNTLSRTNVYAIALRLATAKTPEPRQRRFDALLAMLERGEKLP
jgi:uncharacterized protein YdeI (YjbR/CyaY-like superfamily)